MSEVVVDLNVNDGVELLRRAIVAGQDVCVQLHQRPGVPVQNRRDEVLLAVDEAVDRRRREARDLGYLADGRIVVAVDREDLFGGIENVGPAQLRPLLTQPLPPLVLRDGGPWIRLDQHFLCRGHR